MSTEILTPNTQVAIIEKSIELFRTAPQILQSNQERSQKALIIGKSILDQWSKSWTIENEEERLKALAAADERSNGYLVKCNNALKEEKEVRAAITQMMDEFKKMFTTAENDIDKAKDGTIPNQVQKNRNSYVLEANRIAELKRKEAERIAAKSKEAIDIKANIETIINNTLINLLSARKQGITNSFNSITLDDFEEKSQKLNALRVDGDVQVLKAKCLEQSYPAIPTHHTYPEVEELKKSVFENYPFEGWVKDVWASQITILKDDLIEKLPSLKNELLEAKRLADKAEAEKMRQEAEEKKRQDEIAKAEGEKKAELEKQAEVAREEAAKKAAALKLETDRLEAEKKQREDDEKYRQEQEAEATKKAAELSTEMKKQGEQTMTLFETESALSEITPTPEARQSLEITVKHPAGYVQIFQLWFEKEGKNLPIDKIGNTKLDQMKAWCEKLANKGGDKITSPFIHYETVYKAVATK